MSTRTPALLAALLALLSATEAAAASRQTRASSFAVEAQALAESLCGLTGDRAVAKCRLVTHPDGLAFPSSTSSAPFKSSARRPQWRLTGMDFVADPVATSCGAWNISLRVEAVDPSAASIARANLLTGRLHLANPATGQTADYPLLSGALAKDGDDPDDPPDCLPDWIVEYPELLEKYKAMGCDLCSDIKRFNGPFQ